jgi:hypothetical protein
MARYGINLQGVALDKCATKIYLRDTMPTQTTEKKDSKTSPPAKTKSEQPKPKTPDSDEEVDPPSGWHGGSEDWDDMPVTSDPPSGSSGGGW